MKVCPECRQEFGDAEEQCPDDGAELMGAPDRLPPNPSLRDVVPVSPSDHTAMIDIDVIEAERKRRAAVSPPQDPSAAEQAPVVDEEPRRDPDATGTFHVGDPSGLERTGEMPAVGAHDEVAREGETSRARRPQSQTKTASRLLEDKHKRPPPRRRSRAPLVIGLAIAAALAVSAGGALAAWWYVGQRGAVLTVTSVPPGARVIVDGKALGTAPLQDRVTIGSHVVELALEGYRPFKEVIDVPAEGLPFLQPLEVDPDYRAPQATGADDDGGVAARDAGPAAAAPTAPPADELVAQLDALLAAKDFEGGLEKIKEIVKHHPDDERIGGMFEKLAEARVGAAKPVDKRPVKRTLSPDDKKREAQEAFAAGEALYRDAAYAEARLKLQAAIQLDPRFAAPHRSVARIFERDGDLPRARYHLERYLRLGGKDPDYRVRRWLEDNKDK